MDVKAWIKSAAQRMGFDLCGIAPASLPGPDREGYLWWIEQGFHGEMAYMERRQRQDIRLLFPEVRSIICAAMVYNSPYPKSIECTDPTRGWISRYAWGDDYHDVMRKRLQQLVTELRTAVDVPFEAKVYVDTAPLLERTIARAAGLGWLAKNTCLINQKAGSWLMVGEILTTLELEPDQPAADHCGTCTRCIDACPTAALVRPGVLDATRCISYFTIETRGPVPHDLRPAIGRHVFGCDICQDVCPWNRKAPATLFAPFQPRRFDGPSRDHPSRGHEGAGAESGDPIHDVPELSAFNPPLVWLASLTQEEFSTLFRRSPLKRARHHGFLRNVATAMGNSREPRYRPALQKLAEHPDPAVQEHARWALQQLRNDEPRDTETQK